MESLGAPDRPLEFTGLAEDAPGYARLPARTPILTDVAFLLGLDTPLQRTLAFGSIFAATMYVMRPEPFFDAHGDPRPWSVLADDEDESILVPWWMAAYGSAAVLAQMM